MKAIVVHQYAPPESLKIEDVKRPSLQANEVLIKIHAAGINPKDALMRKGRMKFLVRGRFPYIPGYDLAGEVVEVGQDVSGFQVGDEVYGMINDHLGGAYAQFAAVPAAEVAHKPHNLNWEQAAAVPLAALTSLQALVNLSHLKAGDEVCINGASGGVGTFAIQIAKAYGARVTAVCSYRNVDLVRALGADEVVDYTKENIEQSGRKFDIFYDAYGNKPPQLVRPILAEQAVYISVLPRLSLFVRQALTIFAKQKVKVVVVHSNTADLQTLAKLIEADKVKPVIDSVLPLAEAAEAHQRIETRRAQGKIVLVMDH
ncbi:MAG: NAD(P)-dependent alcohol dehydrogenase [Anaerolineales bacterium]|nr:NAD(P)-dependent alcohol dehydrogenase [Anaerolineales bacterium]